MNRPLPRPAFPLFLLAALALVLAAPAGAAAQDWLNIKLNQDATTQLQNEEQVITSRVNTKDDIYDSLKTFFSPGK